MQEIPGIWISHSIYVNHLGENGRIFRESMTTHFLVVGHEGSTVRVSRSSRGAWLVFLPLPVGLQGTLPDISGSFGYPVEFTCPCLSMNSCVCSHESVYTFWRSVADFLSCISEIGQSRSLLFDSIRKRFVRLYVDLPVHQLTQGIDSDTPGNLREALIKEAEDLFNQTMLRERSSNWDPWPSDPVSVDEEIYSRLFASDIQQLSLIRIAIEKTTQVHDLPGDGVDHFNNLVGSTWSSPVEIFLAASVLDQINLVDISSHMLAYARDLVSQSAVASPESSFLVRINSTLCDRNPMKWKFLPHESEEPHRTEIPSGQNLSKFRSKLSKLLLFKQRARRGERKQYSPVYASDTEDENLNDDPIDTYLVAKRKVNEKTDDYSGDEFELVAEFRGPEFEEPKMGLPRAFAWGFSPQIVVSEQLVRGPN